MKLDAPNQLEDWHSDLDLSAKFGDDTWSGIHFRVLTFIHTHIHTRTEPMNAITHTFNYVGVENQF